MKNLIIAFDGIGEGSMYIVDNKTYDTLFSLYEAQKRGPNGYSEMMEEFWKVLEASQTESVYLQWNTHNHLKKPITFRRILQVLME